MEYWAYEPNTPILHQSSLTGRSYETHRHLLRWDVEQTGGGIDTGKLSRWRPTCGVSTNRCARSLRMGSNKSNGMTKGSAPNGTTGSIGGGIGAGLEINIVQGYEFLAKEYQEGDEIYVLGFSRGAYTARSLVGMVRNCGLIYPKHLGLRALMAYGIYRTRDDNADSATAKLFRSSYCRDVKIKFIGVWDTVGALGVPLDILKDVQHEVLRIPRYQSQQYRRKCLSGDGG